MARFLKPRYVIGGIALYGISAFTGYAYFAKPKEFAPATEEERKATFDKNSSHYDDDVHSHERTAGILKLRQRIISQASGVVCEVGAGTGRNVTFYGPNVQKVSLVDFSNGMLQQAKQKVAALPAENAAKFTFVEGDAQRLPFADASFDSVVDTFSLCSFEDPAAALKEMARVTKPGGKLLLVEHGKAKVSLLNKMLDKSTPGHVCKHGCYWNRDIDSIVKTALTPTCRITEEERKHLGTTYVYVCEKLQ